MTEAISDYQTPEEHPFAAVIRTIGKGKKGRRSLSEQEAEQAMQMILDDKVAPEQLGAFLMLLRVKEETPEEIAGFVRAARRNIAAPHISCDVDWSSYAGKKKQLPWYLLSALLLAQAGHRVFMHGTGGHTPGRLYTEQVLATIGLPIAASFDEAEQQLDARNFCFMPLRYMCPGLQSIIDLRPLMGLRSPVHTLTRLINPLAAKASLQSIFHPGYANIHHGAAQRLGEQNACVFKGEAGEAEYKPHANVAVKAVIRGQTQLDKLVRRCPAPADELPNTDNIQQQWLPLWRGEKEHDYGRLAIIGTTAIALYTLQANNGTTPQTLDSFWAPAEQLWAQRDKNWL